RASSTSACSWAAEVPKVALKGRRVVAKRRRRPDPIKAWVRRLDRTRPGLASYVLDELSERYGRPEWERRWDPTSELVLTILTQNSADTNAERAYVALRAAYPGPGPDQVHRPGPG